MRIIILFILTFLTGCKTSDNFIGEYYKPNKTDGRHVVCTYHISLNEDSTFRYFYRCGWNKSVSEGTFQYNKKINTILLNSFVGELGILPFTLDSETDNSKEYIVFKLINFSNKLLEVSNWYLYINEEKYPIKTDSIILPLNTEIKNFYIEGCKIISEEGTHIPFIINERIQTEKLKLIDNQSNVFYITFPFHINYDIFYHIPMKTTMDMKKKEVLIENRKIKLKKSPSNK